MSRCYGCVSLCSVMYGCVCVIMLVGVWYNHVDVCVMALRWKRGRQVRVEMSRDIKGMREEGKVIYERR